MNIKNGEKIGQRGGIQTQNVCHEGGMLPSTIHATDL